MSSLPSPLHPAVVHFPIVLILLGTAAAIVAAFMARTQLRILVVMLLVLGAGGTVVAVSTGERDGEAVDHRAATETLLDAHEDWAERTQAAALAAAALAVAAVLAFRWPTIQRGVSAACAIVALGASVCVYQTGHRGGQLVYRHGAGVNLAPAGALSAEPPSAPRHRDDD